MKSRRFVRLITVTWVVFLVVLGGILVLRSTPRALALNPPGCELPCILGVIPGVTTRVQAEKMLSTFDMYQDAGLWEYPYQLNETMDFGVRYIYPDEPHTVYEVGIKARTGSKVTTLGNMLSAGYKINRIVRSNYAMADDASLFLITFDAGDQIIGIVTALGQLSPTSELTDLYVIGGPTQNETLQDIKDQWHCDEEIQWTGFSSVLHSRTQRKIVRETN